MTEDSSKSKTAKVEDNASKNAENKEKSDVTKSVGDLKKEDQSDLHQRFRDAFPPAKRKELTSDDSKAAKAIEDFDNYLKSLSVKAKN